VTGEEAGEVADAASVDVSEHDFDSDLSSDDDEELEMLRESLKENCELCYT
jgi:hypothetical protein